MSWYFNLECCACLTSNIKPWCSESWEAPWDNIQTPISWRWSCNPGTHLVIQILHNTSNWVFKIYGGSGSCQHAKGTLRESQQKLVGNVILYWSGTKWVMIHLTVWYEVLFPHALPSMNMNAIAWGTVYGLKVSL